MEELNLDLDLDSTDLKTISIPSNNNNNNVIAKENTLNSMPDLSSGLNNINLNEGQSDDFGLSLLVNKKKQKSEEGGGSSSGKTSPNDMSSNFFSSNDKTGPETINVDDILNDTSFEDNLNIDLNTEMNKDESSSEFGMDGPSLPSFGSSNNNASTSNVNTSSSFEYQPSQQMSFEEIQKAKFDLLCKFERLRDKGVRIPKTFSMSSDYDEMKYEYDRLVHQRKMDNSVKMQRQMLISLVTGCEFLNNKFDPFDLKLDNWSEQVHENINDYDDVFEELYEKYKDSASMAPELRLMFMVAGSGFMYHLSNTMFKSALPGVGDIMRQNPDLMKQFTSAAMNTMGQQNPGFAGFMGNVMGGGNQNMPPPPNQFSNVFNAQVPPFNPMSGPPFSNPTDAPPRQMPNMNNNGGGNMRPSELDDILADISGSKDMGQEKEINLNL
jgi:hypothetical protein